MFECLFCTSELKVARMSCNKQYNNCVPYYLWNYQATAPTVASTEW